MIFQGQFAIMSYMTLYELTYIITPEISSEEAEAKAREIESFVQKSEGAIIRQTNPSAKALAYPVKNSASGFMGVLEFQMEPENLQEFQKDLKKDEKIIRKMLIVKEAPKRKKEKRSKPQTSGMIEPDKKSEEAKPEELAKLRQDKEKIELKDIEQKLDELLGE